MPAENRGRQVPVVIKRGMLRVQFDGVVSGLGRWSVSHLKWGGDETYAEVLFVLLAKSPTFFAATGVRLRRSLLCDDDLLSRLSHTRPRAVLHDRLSPSQLSSDGPRATGGLEYPVVWLCVGGRDGAWPSRHPASSSLQSWRSRLVGSQYVRRRGIRVEDLELISRRAVDDAKAVIAGKPVPRLLASREWVFNTSFNYGFIFRSRRPKVCQDVLYASLVPVRVRQLIYSRRPPQQVQSARYQYNSLRAFLCPSDQCDFLELFPEFEALFCNVWEACQ